MYNMLASHKQTAKVKEVYTVHQVYYYEWSLLPCALERSQLVGQKALEALCNTWSETDRGSGEGA